MILDSEGDGKGECVSPPLGKTNCTVFRKVMSAEGTIHEFTLQLRTEDQARAFRVALQAIGDLWGFGLDYFDLDRTGRLRTSAVSTDNSSLMRSIRRRGRAPEESLAGICRTLLAAIGGGWL